MRNSTLQLKASAVGSPSPVQQTAQALAIAEHQTSPVKALIKPSKFLAFINYRNQKLS